MLKWFSRSTYDQGVRDTFDLLKNSISTETLQLLHNQLNSQGQDQILIDGIKTELDRRKDDLTRYKEHIYYTQ